MTIENELSGEVAVAVIAQGFSEDERDKRKLKEIIFNFHSTLRSLTLVSHRVHLRTRIATTTSLSDVSTRKIAQEI